MYGRKVKKKTYDTPITMLFEKKQIEKFKALVGKGYQTKIRELVQDYIDACTREENDRKAFESSRYGN